jgi:hypothetical protein
MPFIFSNGQEPFINVVPPIVAWSQRSNGDLSGHNCCSNHSGRRANIYNAFNSYIASQWRSSMLCCSGIPAKFQSCKPSFCEVPYGTFCKFSIFSLFLLRFLAFFPIMFFLVFLFPFGFLSPFRIVTS